MPRAQWISVLVAGCALLGSRARGEDAAVRIARVPPTESPSKFYVSNKPPLHPSYFVKLPIGRITPGGWLRNQLELEANGMTGHLEEISQWCKFGNSAWNDPEHGKNGWEEMPYWLKGYGDLGYVLKDGKIIAESKKWIEAILSSQREDGWFGPRILLTSLDGKADLWPNMLALNVLQSYYEYTNDERVLPFMAKYFKWEMSVPEKDFLVGYWPKIRGGDNLESIYWLYNRTGDTSLLDVAKKVHDHTAPWSRGVINWHNVNVAQSFREPAEYWQQAGDDKFRDATYKDYDTVMAMYGQVPGGGFIADENARPGHIDPRGGFETCGMVEYMHSFEMLMKITGDAKWIDRCEDVAFNSLPAALTPDFKGLHYLTCANQVSLDPRDKSPGVENGGTMFSYSPGAVYRCCQHNVAMGWPYYAEELWLATPDNGLCASLYCQSEVSAKVGDGAEVKISEQTNYPFSDTIELKVSTPREVKFPLYLRVPGWCEKPELKVNGQAAEASAKPDQFLVIDRTWKEGDTLFLKLPMKIKLRKWEKNKGALSVDRGPLTFALEIGEKWQKYGGSDQWPDMEVLPTTAWNYGLVLDPNDPGKSFTVEQKNGPPASQRFTAETTPIQLKAKARKIPAWTTDAKGLIRPLEQSPIKSDERTETVTLIPMGAARLRISSFPVIGTGPDAHEWPKARKPPEASWVFPSDTTEALNDGLVPKNSNDHDIPRFTWWDHKGTREWVQYEFDQPRKLSSSSVYWFDDSTHGGGCAVPASWKLLVRENDRWKPVSADGSCPVDKDKFSTVHFSPVETKAVRLVAQLRQGFSGGILEWKIE